MSTTALAGVKILDFGWALVGALTTKYLADQGAEVVKVESGTRLDLTRTNRHVARSTSTNLDDKPWYVYMNTSKYSITLDLKNPDSRGVLEKLIKWSDVVNENFTPGTLNKLGLGYNHIKKMKPEIIMLSSSVFGQTGPLAQEWGIDSTGNAMSGRNDLAGWPDREPVTPAMSPFGDILLPYVGAMAIVAALDYKQRTGKGSYIDAAMLEVTAQQIIPAFLDWQVNNHLQTRTGNRINNAAPHGVFPCSGDDRWCTIAVFTDDEWASFCRVIGNPQWTNQSKFASLKLRKQNEDELENLVADWTRLHSAEDIMRLMQASGVPAGIVQNAEDIMDKDMQLQEREFMVSLQHPVLGAFKHPAPPYKFLNAKPAMKTAPCMGEHTEYVCTKLIGMLDKEFIELEHRGVFK